VLVPVAEMPVRGGISLASFFPGWEVAVVELRVRGRMVGRND